MSRKEIVARLSEHLGVAAKYLRAPSFAYEVGDYKVERDGNIKNKAGEVMTLEQIINKSETSPVKEEAKPDFNEPETIVNPDVAINPSIDAVEVTLPMEGHSPSTLKNLINMIYSKQELIKKALNLADDIVDKEFVEELNDTLPTTIDDFITMAQGECYGIHFEVEAITFISHLAEPDETKAFMDFVSLLNLKAKELKYTFYKPVSTDNEKYAFRTWLIRLGMIGHEYQTTRKALLKNLSGNGAFRKKQ